MKKLTYFLSILFLFSCQNNSQEAIKEHKKEPFQLEEIAIDELQQKYQNGDLTIEKVVQQYLDRIKEIDQNGPEINSVIEINPDAITIAKQLDEELKNGNSRGSLHGIPILLKDNIDTHDKMQTTAGSRALLGSKPLADSWVAKKLREAGAVILGKANLSEWANFRGNNSTSGWSGIGGQTKNPYILDRNPCGSSAGSGASVSANLTVLAIGTETNGSIVCPSTTNGIVGIKPTVGLISRSGIIPISFTQDTPGPMARTVRDAAICLSAMIGIDSLDSKTFGSVGKGYVDYTQFLKADGLKGKKIGLYKRPYGKNYKVDTIMNKTVEYLKSQGVEIVEIEQISEEPINGASFQVMLYEFKDGLNKYFKSLGENAPIKSLEELIEFNKKDSIELMHFDQELLIMAQEKGDLSEKSYQENLEKMTLHSQKEGIDKVMNKHNLDAIIAPTGAPAWKTDWVNGDHYILGSSSPAAISGYPNITVPMGFVDELPVGISFFGRAWSEPILLEIAYAFEQGTKARRAPKFLEN